MRKSRLDGETASVSASGLSRTTSLEKDFSVFFKHRSPDGSLGRCLIAHCQTPLRLGTVFICPGDVVMGDIDGRVVVPRRLAVEVLLRAEEMLRNDRQILTGVAEGQTIEQIGGQGGYI